MWRNFIEHTRVFATMSRSSDESVLTLISDLEINSINNGFGCGSQTEISLFTVAATRVPHISLSIKSALVICLLTNGDRNLLFLKLALSKNQNYSE